MEISIYKKSLKNKNLLKISKPLPGSWIFIQNLSKDDIDLLNKEFKLNKKNLEDVFDEFTQPRLEIVKDFLYIFLKIPYLENNEIKILPILIILTPKFIFTIFSKSTDVFTPILDNLISFTTTQKTKFFLLKLNLINNSYRILVNKLIKISEEFHSSLYSEINDKKIIELSKLEILLSTTLSSLITTYKVYEKLLFKKYLEFLQEEKTNVDDLSFDMLELIEIVNSNIKRLRIIKDNYQMILDRSTNKRILTLTIITVILFIPTIIFSYYGMNIPLPFQYTHWSTVFISVISLVIPILGYFWFKNKLK
ncbi:MAG: hypothetical protein KatS3mg095_0883 [Candidatus Parcubacteria bacterium]|nr:MAG: hypothetical protein KatS3mg095_0883 [Candidatus Parcubacteria bacterium]